VLNIQASTQWLKCASLTFAAIASLQVSTNAYAAVTGFELEVLVSGENAATLGEGMLGCVGNENSDISNCSGSGAEIDWGGMTGAMSIDDWNVLIDPDPIISGTASVTNNTLAMQWYTLIFSLPIAPSIPGGTLIGGSIQGGVTDNTGDGATLMTAAGMPFYQALIDGSQVATLYPAPTSVIAGGFDSANLLSTNFGAPIPSQSGPAALSTIGIRLDFMLSAGDSATFTSNFIVEPIPVPATAIFFASALASLFGFKRLKAS